jgi:hypothetical protein
VPLRVEVQNEDPDGVSIKPPRPAEIGRHGGRKRKKGALS